MKRRISHPPIGTGKASTASMASVASMTCMRLFRKHIDRVPMLSDNNDGSMCCSRPRRDGRLVVSVVKAYVAGLAMRLQTSQHG